MLLQARPECDRPAERARDPGPRAKLTAGEVGWCASGMPSGVLARARARNCSPTFENQARRRLSACPRLDRALPPQLAALLTSLPIFSSTAALSLFRAKEVGQMSPSSRFAASWKPKVAYLDLNFCPLWRKQITLPSLAYAGIPYQVFGESIGALALITAWSRLAMPRSGYDISAIFASTSLSPSASPVSARLRSLRVSFMAARSSSESKLDPLAPVLRADFFLSLMTVPPVCGTSPYR